MNKFFFIKLLAHITLLLFFVLVIDLVSDKNFLAKNAFSYTYYCSPTSNWCCAPDEYYLDCQNNCPYTCRSGVASDLRQCCYQKTTTTTSGGTPGTTSPPATTTTTLSCTQQYSGAVCQDDSIPCGSSYISGICTGGATNRCCRTPLKWCTKCSSSTLDCQVSGYINESETCSNSSNFYGETGTFPNYERSYAVACMCNFGSVGLCGTLSTSSCTTTTITTTSTSTTTTTTAGLWYDCINGSCVGDVLAEDYSSLAACQAGCTTTSTSTTTTTSAGSECPVGCSGTTHYKCAAVCNSGYVSVSSFTCTSGSCCRDLGSPLCGAATTTTTVPVTYSITGIVYIDLNENGSQDPGESGYSNATVNVGGVNTITNAAGSYSRSGILAGTYNVTLALPNGYSMSSGDPANPKSIIVGPNATANFGIIPTAVTYTTTGYVFVDDNLDGVRDPRTCISNCGSRGQEVYSSAEACYSGDLSVKFTPDSGGSDVIQSFTSSNVNSSCNTYSLTRDEECGTISVTGLADGYKVVILNYKDNTHVSSTVSNSSSIHVCGSEVNFGVSNSSPWIQTIDADIRIDSGFDDPIPTGASCGTSIGSYASMTGSGGTPGIIFSGDSSYSFGQGQASINPYNWVVGGTIYPEVFNTSVSRKTSTEYLLSKAAQLGITPMDIVSSCGAGGIANCNLSGALLEGIYVANGDLVLNGASYTFPANKNYIIIVKGNLTINEKVLVPNGSTAIFSAYNINVGQAVGESDSTSTASDIEGWYSADLDFTINGINNCGVSDDLRLNIGGNVVVGASGGNGSFQNNRDLCSANTSCPSLYIKARPDFILNAPAIIKTSSYTWQEVAP